MDRAQLFFNFSKSLLIEFGLIIKEEMLDIEKPMLSKKNGLVKAVTLHYLRKYF